MAQQTLNNGEGGTVIRGKINDNFTELYARSNWNTTGGTTVTTPTITGNVTFTGNTTLNGKIIGTKTETAIDDARPVIIPLTYQVQPSSAPGSSVDYHGIDISMTASGNTNTNTRLYPCEITTGHAGTGTLGSMVNLYTNGRNTSSGTVEELILLRQRVTNSGGGTISNLYHRRVNVPVNSSGTITNFYADYIENVTSGSTLNWGYYSLMAGNYMEGLTIGVASKTAHLHIKAGTATAGTAPLKLTAGTNLSVVENGAFEFDGTDLFFTSGGVRKTITMA